MPTVARPSDALKENTAAYDAFINLMTYVGWKLPLGGVHLKTDLRDMVTATARMAHFWGPKPEGFDGYHHTNMVRTLERMDIPNEVRL